MMNSFFLEMNSQENIHFNILVIKVGFLVIMLTMLYLISVNFLLQNYIIIISAYILLSLFY
jgi:hypothetical protein